MTELKTRTLGRTDDSSDNPEIVICDGHVDVETFNKAFRNEGWSSDDLVAEQSELTHGWITETPEETHLAKEGDEGAKPATYRHWD